MQRVGILGYRGRYLKRNFKRRPQG